MNLKCNKCKGKPTLELKAVTDEDKYIMIYACRKCDCQIIID